MSTQVSSTDVRDSEGATCADWSQATQLITGSATGSIRVFTRRSGSDQWTLASIVQAHDTSIRQVRYWSHGWSIAYGTRIRCLKSLASAFVGGSVGDRPARAATRVSEDISFSDFDLLHTIHDITSSAAIRSPCSWSAAHTSPVFPSCGNMNAAGSAFNRVTGLSSSPGSTCTFRQRHCFHRWLRYNGVAKASF